VAQFKHAKQRSFHVFRYGIAHYQQHRREEPHPHKRRSASPARRKQKRNLRIALAIGGTFAVVVVVMAFAASIRVYQAGQQLNLARSTINSLDTHRSELLTAQGRAVARSQLEQVSADAQRAAHIVSNFRPLAIFSKLPLVGAQRQGVADLANDLSSAAQDGLKLLNKVDVVDAESSGTTINLASVSSLQQTVGGIANSLILLERPQEGLLGPLGNARDSFNAKVATIVSQLDRGSQILGYVHTFLGGSGRRSYLLAAQNNSEMRDQGSVLSVADLSAVGGRLSVTSPTSVENYPLAVPVNVPTPAGTAAVFGPDLPTQLWQNTNVTADFPWSGSVYAAMYQQSTGQAVDGVIAVDVPALASLLQLSGPVTVTGITGPVTSGNVEGLLLHGLYASYPVGSQTQRKDLQASVAKATFDKLSSEHVDPAQLAHALAADVAGRHLLLYDATPANENILKAYGASGALDTSMPQGTFHLAVENSTATKLDYYIKTSIHQRISVTPAGLASVFTDVTVTNTAPAGQSPSYQLGPDGSHSHVPGEYVGSVYFWVPRGALQAGSTAESGLQVTSSSVDVLAGENKTIRFATILPHAVSNGALRLRWIPQSTLHPQTIGITVRNLQSASISEAPQSATLSTGRTFTFGTQGG